VASAPRSTRYTPAQHLAMEAKADFKSEHDGGFITASIDYEVPLREIYAKVEFSGEAASA